MPSWDDLISAVLGALAALGVAYLSLRGKKGETRIDGERAVQEGYARLVASLQAEVDRLAVKVTELEQEIGRMQGIISELRQANAEQQRIIGQYATCMASLAEREGKGVDGEMGT